MQASHPMMNSTWFSEYTLSVLSVSVMCGCALMDLDNLDPYGCSVFESLMSWM